MCRRRVVKSLPYCGWFVIHCGCWSSVSDQLGCIEHQEGSFDWGKVHGVYSKKKLGFYMGEVETSLERCSLRIKQTCERSQIHYLYLRI